MMREHKLLKMGAALALAVLLVLTLGAATMLRVSAENTGAITPQNGAAGGNSIAGGSSGATGNTLYFISDLPGTKKVGPGEGFSLMVSVGAQGEAVIDGKYKDVQYLWYHNGVLLDFDKNENGIAKYYGMIEDNGQIKTASNRNKLAIATCANEDAGGYRVRVLATDKTTNQTVELTSAECNVTLEKTVPAKSTGSLYVTGYTVVDAAGAEVQKMTVGQKYKIIVGLRDGRFTTMPSKKDQYNNIVNIKVASTAAFATPTLGDVGISTPVWVDATNEIAYAATFTDIIYQGGDNKLSFDVAYVDQSVEMQTINTVITQGYDTSKIVTAKPTVMVQSADYGGQNVSAGAQFTLNLTSYNTSSTLAITDVGTSLTLPESLTLAGGTNTILTSSVGPGASFNGSFALQAQSSVENSVANITVNYTFYVQGTDTPLTASQIITVPLIQPERFSVTTLDVPAEIYAGEEGSLTINYVNKGKGTLYNLSAEISGNLENPGQNQYLGNLNSGTEGSADFILKSEGVGVLTGTVTLIYEDVNGAEKRLTQDYSVTVTAAPAMPDMPIEDLPEETTGGMPWWVWVIIAAAVVGVAVGVGVGVKKAKAKKRAAELADDDDEENGDEA